MPRRRYRSNRQTQSIKASLCVTCLVDQFFPEVGIATVNSLRKAGVDVDFPSDQTCCGQIAFNGGFQSEAKKIAERFLDIFIGIFLEIFLGILFRHPSRNFSRPFIVTK